MGLILSQSLLSTMVAKRAVQVNIQIMRAFIKLRRFVLDNEALRRELEDLKQQTENRFQIVFETLDRLIAIDEKPKRKIGF